MMQRLQRLRSTLEQKGCDAFLMTQKPNQLYFLDHPDPSGLFYSLPYLLVTRNESIVFPGVWFYPACRDLLVNEEVVPNFIGDPDATEQLAERIKRMNLKRVAVDGLNVELAQAAPSETEFVSAPKLGPELRRTKELEEIELMRRAAAISDTGISAAFNAIRPGVRNCEVAAEGVYVMLKMGCESAEMFVASGPDTMYLDSGSDPRRVIQSGEMVFIDMAIRLQGYLGDQTRAAILTGGTREQRDLLATIKSSYRELESLMKPGASTRELYEKAVNNVEVKGWGRFFVHHLSHGLGLGNDLPNVNATSDDVLQVGDTLSLEPGVYVPGIGGARVENMILIHESGAEALTKLPIDMTLKA
jgi:Xaa-Pro aminopeptidase